MPIVFIDGLSADSQLGQFEFEPLEHMVRSALKGLRDLKLQRLGQVSVIPRSMPVHRRGRSDVKELMVMIEGSFVGAKWPSRTSETFQRMAEVVLDVMVQWAHAHDGPFEGNKVKPWIEVLARPFPIGQQTLVVVNGGRVRRDHAHEAARVVAPVYEVVTGGYACSEPEK